MTISTSSILLIGSFKLYTDEISLIYEEINLLKDEDQNQNVEIAMLKELVGSQKNDDNPILNENPDNKIRDSLDMMDQHSNQKRPVRLLPPSFFRNEKNETANPIRRFYGPPTNCSELSQLGYTLNGYYQVKSTNISDINQVETVYCQFKQPGGIFNPSGNEKRISTSFHLQLPKTGSVGTGVHFYAALEFFGKAEATASKSIDGFDTLPTFVFSDVGVNIGDAYDSKSGVFKAPKSGGIIFSFWGTSILVIHPWFLFTKTKTK